MLALFSLVAGKKKPAGPPRLPAQLPPMPPQLLAELTGLEAMQSRRPEDRRRRPRLDRTSEVTIDADLPTGRVTLAAHVCDMSAEGISFHSKKPLPQDTPFHATLVRVNGRGFVEVTCTVRRCEPMPDGRFTIGGAFVQYRVFAAVTAAPGR